MTESLDDVETFFSNDVIDMTDDLLNETSKDSHDE